ncbi:hypothetical protein NVS55_37785 [Myxococcus stipitatus]|uniref:hypothetical protein n=1 Tax=Myxococcus stipitatus TaxID=83455 RepID=UPI0031451B36
MKKLAVGVCLVGLCLTQGTAQGAEDCIQTLNQGAATVPLGLYEQSCPTITWNAGVITSDVTYNCCGPSAVIRVNGSDWNQLVAAGKLDSLRYQHISKGDSGYIIRFRKVVGTSPTDIAPNDFFK